MSDDRKYRHRGYMDGGKADGPRPKEIFEGGKSSTPGAPRGRSAGFEKDLAIVCKKCGSRVTGLEDIGAESVCPRCGQALHSCSQCAHFDPSSRWECSKSDRIPARIAVKTARNDCPEYAVAASFDMTGRKAADSPADARKAFEALFKK